MKKLTRKLFLSIAALAVCAATLVSTTFAWYVSNDTAEVNSMSGAILSGGAEGNILVAKDVEGSAGNFTQTLTFEESSTELDPITRAKAAKETEYAIGDWMNADGTKEAEKASPDKVITYTFWILSTIATDITIEAKLENTTTEWQKQTVFNTTGLPGTVGDDTSKGELATAPTKNGDQFTADAVKALYCTIHFDKEEGDNVEVEDVEGLLTGLMPTYKSPQNTVSGGDANQYYKAIIGTPAFGTTGFDNPLNPQSTGASDTLSPVSWSSMELTAGVARKITISIWLEGTSAECWDSCKGQKFSLALTFNAGE